MVNEPRNELTVRQPVVLRPMPLDLRSVHRSARSVSERPSGSEPLGVSASGGASSGHFTSSHATAPVRRSALIRFETIHRSVEGDVSALPLSAHREADALAAETAIGS